MQTCRAVYDDSVFFSLPERSHAEGLEDVPTDSEISLAISKLHDSAPGASGLRASAWKALADDRTTFDLIRNFVIEFWESEVLPCSWEVGLLSILPKKGDLSLPGNYRGIMMLEVGYKIIGHILLARLKIIKEDAKHLDHEAQCGFRNGRGCTDGTFTVKSLVTKRREHNQETWILFLDLVKAFDTVPRELLWRVLTKLGVPDKLVSILKAMHKNVEVLFEVDGVKKKLNSIIGVKQGDLLGPELFTFYMSAVLETWRSLHSYDLCIMRSKEDFILTGRNHKTGGKNLNGKRFTEFAVSDSEYADDTAIPFTSRSDAEIYTPLLMEHFRRWGLEVHAGSYSPHKDSKTEVLFCARPLWTYQDKETLDDTNLDDITLPNGRFIPVISEFRYLGSYITRDGTDTKDVRARINSAARAFGALSKCIFQSRHVKRDAKRAVYERLILSICLYGCESWCLKETLYTELRQFHARCVRTMSRTNLHHTWIHRISTKNLEKELGLDSMNNYIARRQLRWLGHVSRMPFDRLPRRMLSSWFPAPRCRGATKMTYGRTMKKAMATFDINPQNWYELAADREKWHAMIK